MCLSKSPENLWLYIEQFYHPMILLNITSSSGSGIKCVSDQPIFEETRFNDIERKPL